MIKESVMACALALSMPASQNTLGPADKTFFDFLLVHAPKHDNVLAIVDQIPLSKLFRIIQWITPGGFIVSSDDRDFIRRQFKERQWERLPFIWRGFHIYRKPYAYELAKCA